MDKTILPTKQLTVNNFFSSVRSQKILKRVENVSKEESKARGIDINTTNPQRQFFQILVSKCSQPRKKETQSKELNFESLIFKILQAKNPIEREKAKIKIQKKQQIVLMVQKMQNAKKKEGQFPNKEQKTLRRTMTLKQLSLMQKKNEAQNLHTFLSPGIRFMTQTLDRK